MIVSLKPVGLLMAKVITGPYTQPVSMTLKREISEDVKLSEKFEGNIFLDYCELLSQFQAKITSPNLNHHTSLTSME